MMKAMTALKTGANGKPVMSDNSQFIKLIGVYDDDSQW